MYEDVLELLVYLVTKLLYLDARIHILSVVVAKYKSGQLLAEGLD